VEPAGARDALGELLGSEDEDLRYRAALALGRLGDRRAVPILIDLLGAGRSLDERKDAVRRLGYLGDPQAVDVLLESVADSHLRYRAVTSLGMIGDRRAVEPLVRMLDGEQRGMIRDGVTRALGWLGDGEVLPALVDTVRRHDELVYASESLVRLGAIEHGAAGGLDASPSLAGRPGIRSCHRGDPDDVSYKALTWCETAGGEISLPLRRTEAGGEGTLLLADWTLGEPGRVRVSARLGGRELGTFEIGPEWSESRLRVPAGLDSERELVLTPDAEGARLGLDHALVLPAPARP